MQLQIIITSELFSRQEEFIFMKRNIYVHEENNSFHENNLRKDNSDDEKRDSLLNIDSSEKLKIGLR